MLLPPHAASPEDPARRSQRKTKRIDRDRFATTYSKLSTPRRVRPSVPEPNTHSELHSYCNRLMTASQYTHEPFLLAEMQKAFREQSGKLFSICKIKLKLEDDLTPMFEVPPSPEPRIQSI
jgi:hypothetical protein